MWWLIPIGIGLAVAAILGSVKSEERQARARWAEKYVEVERTVAQHRANIEQHLALARQSYEFHLLTDLHFSSHRVADEAYRLLSDARTALDTVGRLLVASREKKEELKAQLDGCSHPHERRPIFAEIDAVNDFRKPVFDDKDRLKNERDSLLQEVRHLNAQTAELKLAIRDRCGEKGRDWYERLEERNRVRRLSENRR